MEPDQSEHLYAIGFDERAESWFVTLGSTRRLPLSRISLQHLVSLYNEIHRGAPLTLIDRRAMEELGEERRELQDTVRNLYDFIDTEAVRQNTRPGRMARLATALTDHLSAVPRLRWPRR